MKSRLLIATILLLISSTTFATNYYVAIPANGGNDNNPGTLAQPFATWQKLSSVLHAGDTAFIRGGTYRSPKVQGQGNYPVDWRNLNGTSAAHIVVMNYQNELPILNLDNIVETVFMIGFYLGNSSWIDFKGLRVTGLRQSTNPVQSLDGWRIDLCNHITFTQCEVDHMQGPAWRIPNTTPTTSVFTFTNCDADNNGDPLNTGGGVYGNADGFDANGGTVTFIGCRAWWNSDDGFDCFFNDAAVTYVNCWSFFNGYIPGTFTNPGAQADGMGYKWGVGSASNPNTVNRIYTQCISFMNKAWGYDQNTQKSIAQFWNCNSYRNVLGGWNMNYAMGGAPNEPNIFRNCQSYLDGVVANNFTGINQANNSWQVATPVAASFASLDTTGVTNPRNPATGALPNLQFLHLSSNSNQIDRGVNVGLPFCGVAPDLGAYEFCNTTPTLTVAPTWPPIPCFGGTSTVTVGVSGGQAPYQYKIGTGSFGSSNVFTGLIAGTYLFTVRDALGATASQNAFITQPPQITISQVSGTIVVNGGSTTTTVTASGGSGTKNYKLDAGSFQVSNVFTGVLAGTHTITVRDSLLCTNTLTYTLTQPSVLNLSAAATTNPLTCFGNLTTITLTASGGTPPYQYQLNGGAFQSPNTFSNRGAGTYTLTVRDAGGALKTTTLTITQPTQITISQSSTAILVNGGTATTTVTASGGTGAFQYSRDGGAFQSSNIFTGVTAGTHTITVRDANLCTNTLTYTLTQPTSLNVSAVATTNPLTCFGNTTTITVTATGGTTPYQYSINGGTFQSSNLFTNRGAGTYTITVRDAALVTQTTTVTITQPTQIAITESHTAIAVNGGTSTITVTASGGTGTKNYSLDGGIFQASNVFAGVIAGNHTITVRDANLCTNSITTTITQPSQLVVSTSVTTAIACNGGNGVITVTASGGTTPYQYRQGTTGTFGSSNLFTVAAGTYQFFVRDAGGAIVSSTITITQPSIIAVNVGVSGAAPATVTVTASGGVAPLQYRLDAGSFQSSNVFTAVASGNHTVTVRDANLCTQSRTFNVGNPLQILIGFTTINCNGNTSTVTVGGTGGTSPYTGQGQFQRAAGTWTFTITDQTGSTADSTIVITQPAVIGVSVVTGTIVVNGGTTTVTVTATGGTGTKQYSLDGGAFQLSNVFNNVSAGNHSVVVRDANLCTASNSFSISQPSNLNIGIVVGTAIACNGGTTTVTVSGTGGTTPYTYGKNGTFQASTSFTAITAGTYTFSVKDAFSNQHDTIITISQPSALTLSVVTGTISVNGGTTTVDGTGAGGTGGLTYSLDGAGFVGSGHFTGVLAGSHTLRVKDANACITTNTFSISQPDDLVITISRGAAATCYGGTQSITVGSTGGTVPITGTGVFSKLAGTYTFTITDAFGAVADTIITVTEPSQIAISVTTGTILVNGGTTTVTATASGGTSTLQYKLDAGSYQGTGSFSGVSAGQHTVTVKDVNNCTNVNTFSILQPGALFISVTVVDDTLACNGDQTSITVSASGGTTPYTGTGTYNINGGTQTITVTDAFGAQADTIITVYEPALVAVQAIFSTPITVNGGTTDVIVFAAGGTGTLQYKIDAGGYQLSDTLTGVTGGNHTITVKDANNCTGTYIFNLYQPPSIQYYKVRRQARHRYIQIL